MWKIWCKALGQKEGKNNREADAVAVIRTCILIGYMVTNCFIVAGVVRHWNANSCVSNDTENILKQGCKYNNKYKTVIFVLSYL